MSKHFIPLSKIQVDIWRTWTTVPSEFSVILFISEHWETLHSRAVMLTKLKIILVPHDSGFWAILKKNWMRREASHISNFGEYVSNLCQSKGNEKHDCKGLTHKP